LSNDRKGPIPVPVASNHKCCASGSSSRINKPLALLLTHRLSPGTSVAKRGDKGPSVVDRNIQAAKLAKEWNIKIYTIGIGSGQSYTTVQTLMGAFKMPAGEDLDEGLLKKIAETTGGFYSRADDAKALKEIVEKIDSAEKTEVRSIQYTQYAEHFSGWALAALAALMLEILGSCTIFRKIP